MNNKTIRLNDMPQGLPKEALDDVQQFKTLIHERNQLMQIVLAGKLMRDSQKLFYKLRKKVSKTEYDRLLEEAMRSEKQFDEQVDDLLFPKGVSEEQLSLL